MTSRVRKFAVLAAVLPGCFGCGSIDPYRQAGTWRPNGANDGNLAAMVADPSHLAHGREASSTDALMAAAAIERLHRDRVKALIGTDFHVGGGTSATGGAGADAGGDN